MKSLFTDLTLGNLKNKNKSCQKCGKYFIVSERVDCTNLRGSDISYCLKDYDKELKKPETKEEREYWDKLRKTHLRQGVL